MKKIMTFMMTALLVGVVYCQKNTNGEKEIKTEDRKVAAYESVEVSGAYHLVLTEGEGGALKIKGQKEVLPYLKTSVSNKVLYVSIDNKYKLKTSLTVYVPINTSLKKIVTNLKKLKYGIRFLIFRRTVLFRLYRNYRNTEDV